MWFCRKVKAKGFRIFCDLSQPMGHLNVGDVKAHRREDGGWSTVIEFGAQKFEFPTPEPKFKINEIDGSYEELE